MSPQSPNLTKEVKTVGNTTVEDVKKEVKLLKQQNTSLAEELEKLTKQKSTLEEKLTTSSDNLLEEQTKNTSKSSRIGDIILGFVIGFAFTFLIIFVLWFTSLFTETISDVYKEIFCTNALK